MKRSLLVTSLVAFSVLFTYGFARAKQANPPVPVDVKKPTDTTVDNQPYDPNNLPPGATGNEDGYTRWEVKAGIGAASAVSVVKGSGTQTITLTLQKLIVTPSLSITIYLPPPPPADAPQAVKDQYETLKAHENGHKDLTQQVFDLVHKDILQKHLSQVKRVYSKTVPEPVDQAAVVQELRNELNAEVKAKADAAVAEINQQIKTANDAYDAATQNGTQGPGGTPPDPKNQDKASQDAAKDFKKQYKKP